MGREVPSVDPLNELLRAAYEQRFWPKVNQDGPLIRSELGPCWVWTAATIDGYGALSSGGKKGRPLRAHRVSFFIEHGRWPEPFCLHRCDNRLCVRPSHLREGTAADNNRDRVAKGRSNYRTGERHQYARLSDAQVRELRARAAAGAKTVELVRDFDVTERHARQLIQGTRRPERAP